MTRLMMTLAAALAVMAQATSAQTQNTWSPRAAEVSIPAGCNENNPTSGTVRLDAGFYVALCSFVGMDPMCPDLCPCDTGHERPRHGRCGARPGIRVSGGLGVVFCTQPQSARVWAR